MTLLCRAVTCCAADSKKQLGSHPETQPTLVASQQEGLCPGLAQHQRSNRVLAAQQAAAASLCTQQATAACGWEQSKCCPRLVEHFGRRAIRHESERKGVCIYFAGLCLHSQQV